MPLAAGLSSEYVWHDTVDRYGPLLLWTHQVRVKTHISRQLEALILRSEWAHGLVWPHCPLCYSQKYQTQIIRKHLVKTPSTRNTRANVIISPCVKYPAFKSICKGIAMNYFNGS